MPNVTASSFADLVDLRRFKAAKAKGMTDKQAFAVGDNGIGCWGHATAQLVTPMCALPPDDMMQRFGSIAKAMGAHVLVESRENGLHVLCILADRMPWKKNIKNGCGIDLNPAACAALKLKPPVKHPVKWTWA